jgi:RNA polymerase sigma-70 factor (ECF subfamily)
VILGSPVREIREGEGLDLEDPRPNDRLLAHLDSFPQLRVLSFKSAAVTNAGLAHLTRPGTRGLTNPIRFPFPRSQAAEHGDATGAMAQWPRKRGPGPGQVVPGVGKWAGAVTSAPELLSMIVNEEGAGPAAGTAALWQEAERFRPYLKAIAAHVLSGPFAHKADASDVVQDGLTRAFQRLEQYRGRTAEEWRAWLVTIVTNQARNVRAFLGRQRRDVRRERALEGEASGGPQPIADGSSPSQRAMRREQAARLLAALERLAADDQQVLRLKLLQGLPYPEVAERMGRSKDAVRQLLARALRRLRQQWGDAT